MNHYNKEDVLLWKKEAEEIIKLFGYDISITSHEIINIKDAYVNGRAKSAQTWIDVKITLPEKNRYVLVYVPSREMAFMAVLKNVGLGTQWHSCFSEIDEGITHWQPLPTSPK